MNDRALGQVEKQEISGKVAEALDTLLGFELGDFNIQLKVDVHRHPLNGVFAAINELISAFGAEQEQGRAFRLELESKLAMVEKQRAAIRELSTPVIELWDGVLCLPIVGIMDTARSTEMTSALLEAIVAKKTRYTIIDITGIEVMDTRTVDHFIRMAKSVRLLGAECSLTGISPHIAQTVVHMGIDLSDIVTHRSLRDALQRYVKRQR
jgi:rsbT co-antagonist protein RsbR